MRKLALSIALLIGAVAGLLAQTFPAGFTQQLITTGLSNPTAMAMAPDGRIFVCLQGGQVRVIQNGALLATPFVTLSVNSSGERGVIGIAFDPNFATNNYVYIYYTLASAANNRVSRFTANGNVAVAGSELVLADLDPLSTATNHNGGGLKFGNDGKLYIVVGENANTAYSQDLNTYHGKVLRLNPDGTIPAGNPFTTGNIQKQSIWCYGLRNPFTLDVQPGTGKIYLNEVGAGSWEEIDEATTSGLNFGWPNAEGTSTNPSYTNPVYTYAHGTGTFLGCAITGGAFFSPSSTNYPATYNGKYFFMDYCGAWINYISTTGAANVQNFATSINGGAVGLMTGNDGNLYYLSRNGAALFKIVYTAVAAPAIVNQPQSISVNAGQPASFSVTASGTAPLTYQWRKNGSNISGATLSSYSIAITAANDAGNYSVVVTNGAGTTTSNNAVLTVLSPNALPTANITSPSGGTLYRGGDIINFTGTATDPEDGTLPASAFNWVVIFHHDVHTHPGPSTPQSVTSGSFIIPTSGETATNVFYRLYCIVHDSQGAIDSSYVDIIPRLSNITINTNPAGLQVTIDGQPQTSPYTTPSVEGIIRSVGVLSPQTLGGTNYTFSNWTNAGSQTQTFGTPVNDTSFTANFNSILTTISTQSVAATICGGSAISVAFSANGIANSGNVFTAQLSNASGSFSSPVIIGTLSSINAGTITATIPPNTPNGTGYRVRVISSNPSVTGSNNGSNITIAPQVAAAGAITGPSVVCAGDRNVSYKVNPIANATNYVWTLPPGGSIVSGANTNDVLVDFSNVATGGTVKVYGTNAACTGASSSKTVTVNALTPVSFSGFTQPKYYTTSTPVVLTGSPAGGIFSGPGITGNTFYPAVAGIGGPHTITYAYTNAAGCTNSASQGTCVVPNIPGAISGNTKPCPGSVGITYSIAPVAGAQYYNWVAPTGITITGGLNGSSIIVNVASTFVTGRLYVASATSCGISDYRYVDLSRGTLTAPASITGIANGVCLSSQGYTAAAVAGATSYTWSAPTGATITAGQGTASATINYTSTFNNGNVCVTANNSCGASTQRCIAVKKTPATPTAITGPASVCAGQTNVQYTSSLMYGATGYTWTVPIGSTITQGQGTSSIRVTFGTQAGRVGVTATNACGPSGSLMTTVAMPCRIGQENSFESENFYPLVPNPCSNYFMINNSSEIKIIDLSGRLLFSQKIEKQNHSVDVTGFTDGVYMVESNHDGIIHRQKLVVKK